MPPPRTWADLAGRQVGIWGAGVEGRAAVRRLRRLGVAPVVVDDRPAREPFEDLEVLATEPDGLAALAACDVVVKSPGISLYRDDVRRLAASGVAVVGGLALWLEEVDPGRVVGVVGTKGKSTTASILGALLQGLGVDAFVGGNLGRPPYDPGVPAAPELWVVEISSFQAAMLTSGPGVVALTSLHPDHLDWHGDVPTYYRDKLSVCTLPGVRHVVANGDDPELRARSDRLGDRVDWVTADPPVPAWVEALGLLGRHNVGNAGIARACLRALRVPGADDETALERAAAGFRPLESRLQVVARLGGVDFVDDSLSTNALAAVAAVAAFGDRPVALLAGGMDRGIDYTPLAEALARRAAPTLVLALPQNGDRIAHAVASRPAAACEVRRSPDLASAVPAAYEWATPGGVVLLSPAAPSFGLFRDYRERAQVFAEAARALGAGATAG